MTLLCIGMDAPEGVGIATLEIADPTEPMRARYGDHGLYLIRPDQVIAARWHEATADQIDAHVTAIWEGRA